MPSQPSTKQTRRTGTRRRTIRRGVVTVLVLFLVFLFVILAAVVVNWSFLVLVNRDMQHKCDVMALAAAPELLDERVLQDAVLPQTVGPDEGRGKAARVADEFRRRNNAVGAAALEIDRADVRVRTGYVADVNRRPCRLDESAPEHNTVFVFCGRFADGSHPVSYLANLAGDTHAVDIRGGSYATLDNLVVGFRPADDTPSPVMPLAIRRDAWRSERDTDSNGNGIREIVLRLKAARSSDDQRLPPEPNAAVLFYRGSADPAAVAAQVVAGVFPSDLPLSRGVLGPATPGRPFLVAGSRVADADDPLTRRLEAALRQVVGRKRAFPLFRQTAAPESGAPGTAQIGPVQIDGFVAGVVLGAGVVDHRLVVRVEPCFLIHHTLWTVSPDASDTAAPERNLYLHKLRLSR